MPNCMFENLTTGCFNIVGQLLNSFFGYILEEQKDITKAPRHLYCLRTKDNWCKWYTLNEEKILNYEPKLLLPAAIRDVLKPIFMELSSDSLLS